MPDSKEKSNFYPTHKCSFCGKTNNEVAVIITGPGVCICDECVLVCVGAVLDQRRKLVIADEQKAPGGF